MRHKFEDIAFNSTLKKKPTPKDKDTYLGLEHLVSGCLSVARFGSKVDLIGEKLVMQRGDVLFGKRNAYLKRAAIAPFDGIFSAHGMVFRPKEEVVDRDFFPIFISSDYFFDAAIRISVGSISPTINWSALKELEFNLPPLGKQRELAKVLMAAVRAKNAYKELLLATDELIKSQFVEMFGNVFNGQEKYPKQSIATVIDENILKINKTYSDEDVIRYIDISSIDDHEIVQYAEHFVKKAPSRAQQMVQIGDILVSTVRPNLKNVAVIRDSHSNLVASTGFCVLRPGKLTNAEYLFAIVKTDDFAEYLARRAKGANYPAVNNIDIKELKIPLPPLSLQNEFAEFVRQADKSKFTLQQTLKELDATYKAIIKENLG